MTHDQIPLTDEERALARRGQALIAEAVGHPEAQAPQSLREALDRRVPAAHPRRRTGRRRGALAAGLCLAGVLLAALVVALGGSHGGRGAPSVLQVADLARLPARGPAPQPAAGGGPALAAAVQGQAFPNWSTAFDWTASGRRSDKLGGRPITTVFYRDDNATTLGYSIVAGRPLRRPAGHDVVRDGTRYRALTHGSRTTLTWTEGGHTCVIDAPSTVPARELVTLATWDDA
jgi:hypothetical protein